MKTGSPGSSGSPGPADERLAPLFVGIVLVEILAIVGLYWMGTHFAA